MIDQPKTFPPTKDTSKLSDQAKQFCEELILTYDRKSGRFNQAQAYLKAYPKTTDPKTAGNHASRLMRDGRVRAYFGRLQAELTARIANDVRLMLLEKRGFKNKQEDVIRELAFIAHTRMTDLVEWGPDGVTVRASSELSPMFAAAVKRITQKRTVYLNKEGEPVSVRIDVEIETHDKVRALELLGKNVKAFTDVVSAPEKPYVVLIPTRRRPGEPITIPQEKGTQAGQSVDTAERFNHHRKG